MCLNHLTFSKEKKYKTMKKIRKVNVLMNHPLSGQSLLRNEFLSLLSLMSPSNRAKTPNKTRLTVQSGKNTLPLCISKMPP